MFKKILIANRGEIAIRVMRTCREMNIRTVAVYSECDRTALHTTYADESYLLGPGPSAESYLVIEKIIDAAKKSGAEAIHPGYGFLAENAVFAEACNKAGITFIGPSPEAIRTMGNKLEARSAMQDSGVPVIPGGEGAIDSPAEAVRVAKKIGMPVMIKAVAGGGGKGMRLVENESEVAKAVEVTMGEARSGFGDERVFVEKYIEKPKHIEIQVMADQHGSTIAIGERECSMQRRYQKVIEEAPSPNVSPELRAALSKAARAAAQTVNYVGAGTIEFVMGTDHSFYFLEMNTRLQVEHPVTELVYGVDLVREQIRVAAGEKLDIREENLRIRGHAIEARIYAEDPHMNFMPSTGLIKHLVLPEGPGIRNENGIYPGYEIPVYYDPLIGKVVAWAEDREAAIRRARRALEEYQIDGVTTNMEFLEWALDAPGFRDGSYDTQYIEHHFTPDHLHADDDEIELAAIAASIAAYQRLSRTTVSSAREARESIWLRVARMEGLRKPRMKP
jgi:acetyl-CoA carboxylase biotin carboxylase subunit